MKSLTDKPFCVNLSLLPDTKPDGPIKGFLQAIVEEKGLVQVSDEGAILVLVDQVIAANPAQVQQFREGKTAVLQYLVGQLMKLSRGKANPKLAIQMFQEKLK